MTLPQILSSIFRAPIRLGLAGHRRTKMRWATNHKPPGTPRRAWRNAQAARARLTYAGRILCTHPY